GWHGPRRDSPHRGHRVATALADRDPYHAARTRSLVWFRPGKPGHIHDYPLRDTGPGTDQAGARARERGRVGLERGVGPIALVLALEQIALETHGQLDL